MKPGNCDASDRDGNYISYVINLLSSVSEREMHRLFFGGGGGGLGPLDYIKLCSTSSGLC